ncbi:MAG: hypothetical protein ACREOK_08075 [Gemmatimonadaceae bacterium]
MTPVLAAGGQSSVAVSPFVSYVPSAATNPLAGFALTFGGTTGLALRSSAEISISNPRVDSAAGMTGGYRPWGADADAMLFLGGLGGGATVFSRALAPYVFAGIGLTGGDSAGTNVVNHGWSYGLGATIPLGLHADVFGEARWRMNEYVLPTSQGAPDSKSEMRFGLAFHVGGGGSGVAPRPRRRHRMAEQDDDVEYVVTPAPAPAPQVVVVEQQAAPEPVIIVQEQPAPEPIVIVQQQPSEPVIVTTEEQAPTILHPRGRARRTTVTTVTPAQPRVVAPGRSRPPSRVIRGSSRARAKQVQVQVQSQSQRSKRARQGSVAATRTTVTKSTTTVRTATPRVQAKTKAQTQIRKRTRSTTTSTRTRRDPEQQ